MTEKFPYISLHDAYPEHPKVAPLSDAAFRTHVSAICYAHRRQTDGFVPVAVTRTFGRKGVRELVQAGMLIEVEGGHRLHDYEQWNETKKEIERRRHGKRMAGAMGADSRWHGSAIAKTSRVPSPPRVNAVAVDVDVGSADLEVRKTQPPYQVWFAEFWVAYPRKQGKKAAEQAFRKAVHEVPFPDLMEAVERFRDDPNRTAEYTPHPATWLNQGRWDDDPLPQHDTSSKHRLDQHYSRLRGAADGR